MSSAATVLFVILIFVLLLTCGFALVLVKQEREIRELSKKMNRFARKQKWPLSPP